MPGSRLLSPHSPRFGQNNVRVFSVSCPIILANASRHDHRELSGASVARGSYNTVLDRRNDVVVNQGGEDRDRRNISAARFDNELICIAAFCCFLHTVLKTQRAASQPPFNLILSRAPRFAPTTQV